MVATTGVRKRTEPAFSCTSSKLTNVINFRSFERDTPQFSGQVITFVSREEVPFSIVL